MGFGTWFIRKDRGIDAKLRGERLRQLLNLMESAAQVVETVFREIGIQTLALILR
jgi:hypothetical protein